MGSDARQVNTSTQSVAPPDFLGGQIEDATSAARNAFQGAEGFNTTAGRNLQGQTLRGDFLLPDTNPFLQGAFDRGANSIQNRLDTQFAGSGRNIGASLPAAKEGLSDLATGIFGGNFQAERDRQQNALFAGDQFNPLDTFIKRLGGLGQIAGKDITGQDSTADKKGSFDKFLDIFSIF